MANYYGRARSNYVLFDPVKLAALEQLFTIRIAKHEQSEKRAIISMEDGGTPTINFWKADPADPEDPYTKAAVTLGLMDTLEEQQKDQLLGKEPKDHVDEDLDLLNVVHLAFAKDPGDTFIWMEIGSQGTQFLTGQAIALDSMGEILHQVNLSDIYDINKVGAIHSRAEF